jgi:hypothetical protein
MLRWVCSAALVAWLMANKEKTECRLLNNEIKDTLLSLSFGCDDDVTAMMADVCGVKMISKDIYISIFFFVTS